jgi:hypothetical protein
MTIDLRPSVRAMLARIRHDRRGVVAVMLAIILPVIIGAVELGVEPGVWYAIIRKDQTAADAAAITAAYEIAAGMEEGSGTPVSPQVASAAARDAARNNFDPTANTLTISCPPSAASPPPSGTSWPACGALPTKANPQGTAVEVVLKQQETSLLPAALSSLTLGAKAVAQLSTNAQVCALALGTSEATIPVQVNSGLVLSGTCALAANSTDPDAIALANGSHAVTADTIWTAGNYTLASGSAAPSLTQPATTNSFPLQDPYSGTSAGTVPSGSCQNWSATAGIAPLPGVLYCGLSFTSGSQPNPPAPVPSECSRTFGAGSTPWVLAPGTYYVGSGGFDVDGTGTGANLCGIGVTIVLTDAGTININGGKVYLYAPPAGTGPLAGIVFLQSQAADNLIGPAAGSSRSLDLNGLIYTPNSSDQMNVSGPYATCTAVIAQSLTFVGIQSSFTNTDCDSYGISLPPIINVVLAE